MRNGGLDAIRLGAAMAVFFAHARLANGVRDDGMLAAVGVFAFFVLSGYLLPTVYARSSHRYLRRRLARIVPGYLGATIGLAFLTGHLPTIRDFTMTQDFAGKGFDTFMGVAWTLQLEVVFY